MSIVRLKTGWRLPTPLIRQKQNKADDVTVTPSPSTLVAPSTLIASSPSTSTAKPPTVKKVGVGSFKIGEKVMPLQGLKLPTSSVGGERVIDYSESFVELIVEDVTANNDASLMLSNDCTIENEKNESSASLQQSVVMDLNGLINQHLPIQGHISTLKSRLCELTDKKNSNSLDFGAVQESLIRFDDALSELRQNVNDLNCHLSVNE